jgi:hypothetical protein
MLFPYAYVPHQMTRMQEFIDFIFYEIWCKAPVGLVFHPELFNGNTDLKEIMSEFGFSSTAAQRGKLFYKDVKDIYTLFEPLSLKDINQLKQWYQGNNDIENICSNAPILHLARYSDIEIINKDLSQKLAEFFKNLYSNSLLSLSAIRSKIGNIDDHYKNFSKTNKSGKCPFCGINDLLGEYNSKREAYDHYLPKALYPFNSINFYNLVPACHHCNSSYKTSKDPGYKPKDPMGEIHRRKAFYPFRSNSQPIEIDIQVTKTDIEKLTFQDISFQFGPLNLSEEIATWCDIYGIEERYKSKILGENDGKYWVTQVLDEWTEDNKKPIEFLRKLKRQSKINPYAECNFLKEAFLTEYERKGLFNLT